MAYQRKWLRPLKIWETYVAGSHNVRDTGDADYQLYRAVVEGEVRAKLEGKLLQGDELHQIRATKWHDEELYALPPNIELSVEDAERIWGDDGVDPADRVALGNMSFGQLSEYARTALLNLATQIHRFRVRLNVSDPDIDQFGKEFQRRWEKHHREAQIYISSISNINAHKELQSEMDGLEGQREQILEFFQEKKSKKKPKDDSIEKTASKTKLGRKPGVGGYNERDKPLLEKMHSLIETGGASGPWNAAKQVADKAAGNGTSMPESIYRRLSDKYKKAYPSTEDTEKN